MIFLSICFYIFLQLPIKLVVLFTKNFELFDLHIFCCCRTIIVYYLSCTKRQMLQGFSNPPENPSFSLKKQLVEVLQRALVSRKNDAKRRVSLMAVWQLQAKWQLLSFELNMPTSNCVHVILICAVVFNSVFFSSSQ